MVPGGDISAPCIADKVCATILTDNMVDAGFDIKAIERDISGNTERLRDSLMRSDIIF